MAGEHILKLLEETSARIDDGDRWLICKPSQTKTWKFYVYERGRAKNKRKNQVLRKQSNPNQIINTKGG